MWGSSGWYFESCVQTLLLNSLGCAALDPKVPCHSPPGGYGSFVKPEKMEKREEAGKNLVQPGAMKSPSPAEYLQCKKKVIMGREFLLVSHTCLREVNKKFQFFHMPSLSAFEVKIKVPSRKVSICA